MNSNKANAAFKNGDEVAIKAVNELTGENSNVTKAAHIIATETVQYVELNSYVNIDDITYSKMLNSSNF